MASTSRPEDDGIGCTFARQPQLGQVKGLPRLVLWSGSQASFGDEVLSAIQPSDQTRRYPSQHPRPSITRQPLIFSKSAITLYNVYINIDEETSIRLVSSSQFEVPLERSAAINSLTNYINSKGRQGGKFEVDEQTPGVRSFIRYRSSFLITNDNLLEQDVVEWHRADKKHLDYCLPYFRKIAAGEKEIAIP